MSDLLYCSMEAGFAAEKPQNQPIQISTRMRGDACLWKDTLHFFRQVTERLFWGDFATDSAIYMQNNRFG